jgi:hypothetical protein
VCTLSLIPAVGQRGLRLMINRDERRSRPLAWPPMIDEAGGVTLLAPTDSLGTGTWVAAASTGILYALMNASASRPLAPRAGTTSRGLVIRAVAPAADVGAAAERLRTLALSLVAPFRLFAIDEDQLVTWTWDGHRLDAAAEAIAGPRLFASSSLGDHLVEEPRRRLFAALLESDSDMWRAQDRLHLHTWPDRAHLSVNMSRRDACTVSRTTIVRGATRVEMSYAPVLEGWPGPVAATAISRGRAAMASVA